MKKGTRLAKIGEVARLVTRSISANGAPVYSISKHRGFVRSDEYFSKKVHSEDTSKYKYVEPGDFAYSPIHLDEGSIAIARQPGLISPVYRVFEVDAEACDPAYMIRLLKSPRMIARYNTLGDGSVHRRRAVPFDRLAEIEISLPLLEEQRRIATILDQADALRDKRKRALDLVHGLTQSIFLEMFGDPVSNPKGFRWTTLGEVGELDRGVSKHRPRNDPELLGGTHPLIQTGDVANSGGYITTFNSTYSDAGLRQSKKWPVGTLCITIAANIAEAGILEIPACFPDSVVGFTHSNSDMVQFVRVWLSFLQSTIERNAPTVAQKNINLQILRKLPIALPNDELIEEFGAKIQIQKDLSQRLLQSISLSDDLFASLQDRAFSGQL